MSDELLIRINYYHFHGYVIVMIMSEKRNVFFLVIRMNIIFGCSSIHIITVIVKFAVLHSIVR